MLRRSAVFAAAIATAAAFSPAALAPHAGIFCDHTPVPVFKCLLLRLLRRESVDQSSASQARVAADTAAHGGWQ